MTQPTGQPDRDEKQQRSQQARSLATGMGAAWVMIGGVAVGVGIGLAIDSWLDSAPWGIVAATMLFLAGGAWQVIRAGGL